MLTMSQGRRQNVSAGEPIFSPFDIMNRTESHIRKGQLTLIAAGPGCGKSAWILNMLQRGDFKGRKNSVFYFSADSDAYTQWKRAAAIETGWDQSEIDRLVRTGKPAEIEALEARVDKATAHMTMDYRPSPTPDDVQFELDAYVTRHGVYPEVLVFDNVKNCYFSDAAGEFELLEANCEFMQGLAHDIGAAIVGLHHVVGDLEESNKPIGISGIRGKISKTPEVIFTLHRDANTLFVSPVKNRNGKADASGSWVLPIAADLSTMKYEG